MRLGFVGTGELSTALIRGLVRCRGDRISVLVSPRSRQRSVALAVDLAQVELAASNQAAVDGSDFVFVAVLPQQADDVLDGLAFRPSHTVVSLVAGLDFPRLREAVAPASRVHRMVVLPTVARRAGPVLHYPESDELDGLFAGMGTPVRPRNPAELAAFGYAGGLMSSFFRMARSAAAWMEAEGVPPEAARDYLFSMFAALSETGLETPVDALPELTARFETPGGINERCRGFLESEDWFSVYARGLDAMKDHLARLAEAETTGPE